MSLSNNVNYARLTLPPEEFALNKYLGVHVAQKDDEPIYGPHLVDFFKSYALYDPLIKLILVEREWYLASKKDKESMRNRFDDLTGFIHSIFSRIAGVWAIRLMEKGIPTRYRSVKELEEKNQYLAIHNDNIRGFRLKYKDEKDKNLLEVESIWGKIFSDEEYFEYFIDQTIHFFEDTPLIKSIFDMQSKSDIKNIRKFIAENRHQMIYVFDIFGTILLERHNISAYADEMTPVCFLLNYAYLIEKDIKNVQDGFDKLIVEDQKSINNLEERLARLYIGASSFGFALAITLLSIKEKSIQVVDITASERIIDLNIVVEYIQRLTNRLIIQLSKINPIKIQNRVKISSPEAIDHLSECTKSKFCQFDAFSHMKTTFDNCCTAYEDSSQIDIDYAYTIGQIRPLVNELSSLEIIHDIKFVLHMFYIFRIEVKFGSNNDENDESVNTQYEDDKLNIMYILGLIPSILPAEWDRVFGLISKIRNLTKKLRSPGFFTDFINQIPFFHAYCSEYRMFDSMRGSCLIDTSRKQYKIPTYPTDHNFNLSPLEKYKLSFLKPEDQRLYCDYYETIRIEYEKKQVNPVADQRNEPVLSLWDELPDSFRVFTYSHAKQPRKPKDESVEKPIITAKDRKPEAVQKLLDEYGWVLDRISGSHHIYTHPLRGESLSLPIHGNEEIDLGLYCNLVKQIKGKI